MSLLLLFLVLFSSPAALSAVTVTHLPGFNGALPFHLETGYVSVDEGSNVELFYYFLQSERNPREDPLILWLTGGPACSALSALAFEIGPLRFVIAKYNGSLPSLVYNHYSWTKIANIIFLDYPAGTGFSVSTNPNGSMIDDTTSSKQVYEFLMKWFIEHPSFLSSDLYIAGDSYGGKIVPIVTHQIAQGIEDGHHPLLNLKGYLVGNPITDDIFDITYRASYAHGMGIISDELYEVIQRNCEGENYEHPNPLNFICVSALQKFSKLISDIDPAYISDPPCPLSSPKRDPAMIRERSLHEYSEFLLPPPIPDIKCRSYTSYLSYWWANNYYTRQALHIKKGTVKEWVRCNTTIADTYIKDVLSTVIYHKNLTQNGYRALIYSGDKDLSVSFVGTQAWIRSLNHHIIDDWRSWHGDDQVAGYTRKYSNDLTFATVKNAGHTAPEYQPKSCFNLFRRWISHEPH